MLTSQLSRNAAHWTSDIKRTGWSEKLTLNVTLVQAFNVIEETIGKVVQTVLLCIIMVKYTCIHNITLWFLVDYT